MKTFFDCLLLGQTWNEKRENKEYAFMFAQ